MRILFIFVVLIIYGCSDTRSIETQYYVFNPELSISSDSMEVPSTDKDIIVVRPIVLSDYLDQPAIVLQTNTHEITFARYHRWGEPLKFNIHRYLISTLNSNSKEYVFTDKSVPGTSTEVRDLTISIDQFHGTENGLALLSGHWVISGKNSSSIFQPFRYQAELASSGYPELVVQMNSLLRRLIDDIRIKIEN